MRTTLSTIFFSWFLYTSCSNKQVIPDAIAIWSFADLNDQAGLNSKLQEQGTVKFVTQSGDEKLETKGSIDDGKAIYLDGTNWLSAEQGVDGELKIGGRGITLFAKIKLDSLKEYNPIFGKSGNDQSIAYKMAIRQYESKETFVEVLIGSDDIAGAHLLKYKIPENEVLNWHTIVFRFNGKKSELYVDGILRDDEITEGDLRQWNDHPLLIGAEFEEPYINGDNVKHNLKATFTGWIDGIAIYNKYLQDDQSAALFGVASLQNGLPEYYGEKYRPQFHFSAKKNWINDPNGLVYYDGAYHLFYQYMPPHRPGAYKDWGHAVSKDLVHWEQLPTHITPHKVWAGCWSGSAVVDQHNVSGFQKGKEKPIIAFITNGGNPRDGIGPSCTQCIAYSVDGGKTFTYYDQNPIIKNINGANRDPKVVWDEDSKKWIMSLYMDKGYEFSIFTSSNLRDWEEQSTISLDRIAECPGFEPFALDGDKNNKKWVFSGANGSYVVGTFNGKEFKPETGTIVGDYGNNLYAPQTWDNAPEGRKIQIAWLSTTKYPGMPFEQQMNFPTELELKTTPEGIRLLRTPVREIKNLYDTEVKLQQSFNGQGENPFSSLKGDLYDFNLEVDVTKSSSFELGIRGATIHYDAVKKILRCGGPAEKSPSGFPPDHWKALVRTNVDETNNMGEAKLTPVDGKIKLRVLVDRTTVEIYANDGLVVMTSCFKPDETKWYTLSSNGEININASVHSLKSAWTQHTK